jgi:TRAP-type mannitol/chloroaromatic compound transport system substrate-binding protein
MHHGQGLELLREFYRDLNIINFPMGNTGAHMGGWYRKPVRSPTDLKGLRMRMLGLGGRVLESLGGKAVYLSSGETLNALRRGNIDAAEWSAPHDDLRLGLSEVCKQCAYPGWWKGGVQFSLYVNRRAYEALTDENRAMLESAAAAAHIDIQAQYDVRNPAALKRFLATGVKLTPQPKTVMDAAYKAAQALFADLSAKNPRWKKIYTSYAAFLDEQTWGWGQSESGFDSYMHAQQLKRQLQAKK